MNHFAEYRPVWRDVRDTPAPKNTKILLRTAHGTAVIGTWYEEGQFSHWCGLPTLAPRKQETKDETA